MANYTTMPASRDFKALHAGAAAAGLPAYLSEKKHRELTLPLAKDILTPAAARVSRARVACDTHVIYGDFAPTIVRTARRLKCRSIIMGARGLRAIGDLLLGSIATKVIHLAKIPVTLVK